MNLKDQTIEDAPTKYTCAECGFHLLIHSDEMQHKCDYCGRKFKRIHALKTHLILHTGLKPYSCNFCDRTFANGSNCRSHKKKSHPVELAALEASGGEKTYTCNIPKLEALKAFTKTADNLEHVASKQSGCFAFGKKPKPPPKESVEWLNKETSAQESIVTSAITTTSNNEVRDNRVTSAPTFYPRR